jgi:hypothetical protein
VAGACRQQLAVNRLVCSRDVSDLQAWRSKTGLTWLSLATLWQRIGLALVRC